MCLTMCCRCDRKQLGLGLRPGLYSSQSCMCSKLDRIQICVTQRSDRHFVSWLHQRRYDITSAPELVDRLWTARFSKAFVPTYERLFRTDRIGLARPAEEMSQTKGTSCHNGEPLTPSGKEAKITLQVRSIHRVGKPMECREDFSHWHWSLKFCVILSPTQGSLAATRLYRNTQPETLHPCHQYSRVCSGIFHLSCSIQIILLKG